MVPTVIFLIAASRLYTEGCALPGWVAPYKRASEPWQPFCGQARKACFLKSSSMPDVLLFTKITENIVDDYFSEGNRCHDP
jgi:hypothetical protein